MIVLTQEIIEIITDNNAFIVLVKSIAKRASYKDASLFPSINTMSQDTGLSRPTIIKACKWLKEAGIITIQKRKKADGSFASNYYVIQTDLIKVIGSLKVESPVNEIDSPSKGDLPPQSNTFTRVVKEIDSNHKPIEPQVQLTKKKKKKKKKFDAEEYIISLDLERELQDNLLDWLEVRKVKKTPTTQKAIDLNLAKLNSMSQPIKVIQQSIERGWTGFFDLPEYNKNNNNNYTQPISINPLNIKHLTI